MIGTFGKVVFSVSSDHVKTFDEFEKSGSAVWDSQEVIGGKPKQKFKGTELETISFSMFLDIFKGVKPRENIELLNEMRDKGKTEFLIIGGKRIGKHKWYISSMSESWTNIDNKGRLLQAKVSVTLKEFVR
ncbi:phage tail protein [Vallitalea maricola]|uniref:Uncharacterized protein n=1 Tax=Vallitalea maricola TaxID=3074433 RepID=A0ACB5UNB1_9FIRM|nr:hypothetical protein AN2V17_35720 [Vallitalea sp. AN17-2]